MNLVVGMVVTVLAALAVGVGGAVAARGKAVERRVAWAMLPAALAVVGWLAYVRTIIRPFLGAWSGPRLAPAVALLLGYSPYPPAREGPVLGWIYPPMSLLAYLPAASLAVIPGDPTLAVIVGRVLSLVWVLGPVAWILVRDERRGGRFVSLPRAGLLWALFALVVLGSKPLRYVATEIHADAPAIGFGTIALGLLASGAGRSDRPLGPALVAVAMAAWAAWSKQLAAPLVAFVAVVVVLRRSRTFGLAVRTAGLVVLVVLGVSLPLFLGFHPSRLILNVLVIPSRHVLRYDSLRLLARHVLRDMTAEPLWVWLLAAGLVVWGVERVRRAKAETADDSAVALWPFWTAAVLLLPMSLLGYSKLGGDVNALAFAMHPLAVAMALLLGRVTRSAANPVLGMTALVAVVAAVGATATREAAAILQDNDPPWNDEIQRGMSWIDEQRMVVRYLREHPGAAFFPNHPLEHLAVDRKAYHFEYGAADRALANLRVERDHLRRYVPPDASLIVYPFGRTYTGFGMQKAFRVFPTQIEVGELPGCVCFLRVGRTPPSGPVP